MYKTFRFRIYPNHNQIVLINKTYNKQINKRI